jgi:hypothetical protein
MSFDYSSFVGDSTGFRTVNEAPRRKQMGYSKDHNKPMVHSSKS